MIRYSKAVKQELRKAPLKDQLEAWQWLRYANGEVQKELWWQFYEYYWT